MHTWKEKIYLRLHTFLIDSSILCTLWTSLVIIMNSWLTWQGSKFNSSTATECDALTRASRSSNIVNVHSTHQCNKLDPSQSNPPFWIGFSLINEFGLHFFFCLFLKLLFSHIFIRLATSQGSRTCAFLTREYFYFPNKFGNSWSSFYIILI